MGAAHRFSSSGSDWHDVLVEVSATAHVTLSSSAPLEPVMRRSAPGLWAQLPHVPTAALMEAAHDWLHVLGARHFANCPATMSSRDSGAVASASTLVQGPHKITLKDNV